MLLNHSPGSNANVTQPLTRRESRERLEDGFAEAPALHVGYMPVTSVIHFRNIYACAAGRWVCRGACFVSLATAWSSHGRHMSDIGRFISASGLTHTAAFWRAEAFVTAVTPAGSCAWSSPYVHEVDGSITNNKGNDRQKEPRFESRYSCALPALPLLTIRIMA